MNFGRENPTETNLSLLPQIGEMSIREKIGQTCQLWGGDFNGLKGNALEDFFIRYPVGSIFVGRDIIGSQHSTASQVQERISEFQQASRTFLSICGDLEHGAGCAVNGLTELPSNLALAATNDESLAYEYGKWTALEARQVGYNWTFGPVVDLAINWLNPIVNLRSLGQDHRRVAALGAALIRGLQDHGLSATAKHFPGDGVDFRDQHFCLSVNSFSRDEWDETFGHVYRSCFLANVDAVMAGHIALPWIEPELIGNGIPRPATTSALILTQLLRSREKFQGIVVSDALTMAGFRGSSSSYEDLLIESFLAGIDVMLWPGRDYFDIMERALQTGAISEERLDASVSRILAMKQKQLRRESHPLTSDEVLKSPDGGENRSVVRVASSTSSVHTTPHPLGGAEVFATTVAETSVTLVRNQQGLLPLSSHNTRSIQILLGTPLEENADIRMAPLLEGLSKRGIKVSLHINGNCQDLRRKEDAGERYDALLVLFEMRPHALKNTMRPTGAMAECMWTIQSVRTMQPIIISLGSPHLLHDMPWAHTYINAYSSDAHTLCAVEKALFGDIPFVGCSPVPVGGNWV